MASKVSKVDTLPTKDATAFKSTLKYYEQKQFKRGFKVCEQLLKKHPEHGESMAMKGLFLVNLNKKEEGYEQVRNALKLSIKSAVCWHVYGLLYRADKNYDEAIKCYINASRFDKDNPQILRDLAVLQMQTRQYQSLCETRYQLLTLRPVIKMNWISLAMAYHLAGRAQQALGVLDAILEGFPSEPHNPLFEIEQTELFMYKVMILEESERFEESLVVLSDSRKIKRMDYQTLNETRANCLYQLGRKEQASKIYQRVLDYNPDSRAALLGFLKAEAGHDQDKVFEKVKELSLKYPRSLLLKEELIFTCPAPLLTQLLMETLVPMINKGVLNSFGILKKLYSDESKLTVLNEFNQMVVEKLAEPTGALNEWFHLAVAQHCSLTGAHSQAIEHMEKLVELKPNTAEVFLQYARILKRAGKIDLAANCMHHAQSIDPSDRSLNSKAAKYWLRSNNIQVAERLAVKFVKKGNGELSSQLQDLVDMQAIWFAMEMGLAWQRLGDHQKALQYFRQIIKHFSDFYDDQFDFHNYVLRRMTFTSYVRLLRFEDHIQGHSSYKTAVKVALDSVYQLINAQQQSQEQLDNSLESAVEKLSIKDNNNVNQELINEALEWLNNMLAQRSKDADVLIIASEAFTKFGHNLKALKASYWARNLSAECPVPFTASMKLNDIEKEVMAKVFSEHPHDATNINNSTRCKNTSNPVILNSSNYETPILCQLLDKSAEK